MNRFIYPFFILCAFFPGWINAQQVIEIEPLFEYPTAPEELESLIDRCDYVVKHFWDNFDAKTKDPVDQYALNEAFQVYTSTFPYSSKKVVDQSLDNLIQKISGNPQLMLQMGKAAEVNLYGPKAQYWSDEIYLKMIDPIIKNKKISDNRKAKYVNQANILRASAIGESAPTFNFTNKNGEKKNYFPMTTPTLLIFGDPDDTDWRLSRLKMDSNFNLDEALAKGKINILYIIPFESENWQKNVSNYNKHWTVGQSEEVAEHYDLRRNPAVFVVGADGKIIDKNSTVEQSVNEVLQSVN